jgi:ABC-2 type transport system ATP-binding protein
VDRLATRIGIIHQGRLIEELDADRLDRLRASRLEVRVRNAALARRALESAGLVVKEDDGMLILPEERAVRAPDEVASILVQAGSAPLHLAIAHEDLESHFLRLIGRSA